MFRSPEVMFEWEDGSVSAPLSLWIEQILLAMPKDQQGKVLDAVIAEIERRNKIAQDRLKEIEAEIAEEEDETADESGVE